MKSKKRGSRGGRQGLRKSYTGLQVHNGNSKSQDQQMQNTQESGSPVQQTIALSDSESPVLQTEMGSNSSRLMNISIEPPPHASTNEDDEEYGTDESGNPKKTDMVLHPDGLWFHDHSVVAMVTKVFTNDFDGPWTSWKKTPDGTRQRWWDKFKSKYSWDPSHADLVRLSWEKKTKVRLTDMGHNLRDPTYKAKWCPSSIREKILAASKTDAFKRKSAVYRENQKKCKGRHCQGSVSTESIRHKMVAEGEDADPASLFKKTHMKDDKFVDSRAEKLWHDFEEQVASQSRVWGGISEESVSATDTFLEVAGGFSNRGFVYGLGSATSSFYERSRRTSTRFSKMRELESKLDMSTNELQQQKEINVQLVQRLDEQREELDTVKQQLAQIVRMMSGYNPRRTNFRS